MQNSCEAIFAFLSIHPFAWHASSLSEAWGAGLSATNELMDNVNSRSTN